MSFLAVASIVPSLVLGAAPTTLTGTATYRERIALVPESELRVYLDEVIGKRTTTLSEIVLKLNGKQVPIDFAVPYILKSSKTQAKYHVRAEIWSEGSLRFETRDSVPVISNGKRSVNLILTRSAAQPLKLEGPTWQLLELDGKKWSSEGRVPNLEFRSNGEMGGNTGVNGFGGNYTLDGSWIQIDPGPQTMMAGSEDQMRIEREFLEILQRANKFQITQGQLELLRGQKVLGRFIAMQR
ncbi:MAG: META domain-containing protein [Armatimonadetes bacterium]|nr:META domain-containing protein [Armatimonadota bacterium]